MNEYTVGGKFFVCYVRMRCFNNCWFPEFYDIVVTIQSGYFTINIVEQLKEAIYSIIGTQKISIVNFQRLGTV